jgi:FAD/FMN-containing dehydrogenase
MGERKTNTSRDELASGFSGRLVTAEDDDFDDVRALHNAMIDSRPALIAQCSTPDDVGAALSFAASSNHEVAVRAGGHSVAGMSSVERGAVIDVRPMNTVTIDPQRRTARVGAGATWGGFDRAGEPHGLAVTGGRVSTTGVAGFTLGGGSGWIERQYGLACDSLISVDLVLADGSRITASRDGHRDLFWALHGGGGNFGVAISFEFALHPVGPEVMAGLLMWPADAAPDICRSYGTFATGAPEPFGSALAMLFAPPEGFIPHHLQGRPVCAVAVCHNGPVPEGEEILEPLRALGPEADLVGPMPYADFQCMLDEAPGRRNYWGAEYLAALDDPAIGALLASAADMPSPLAQTYLIPWGGAIARVGDADTPMANRDAAWVFHPFGVWESAADDEANVAWARGSISRMRPFSTGATYLNFIGDEGLDRIRAAFGDRNYERLCAIKSEYDPGNVFHGNQNIRPVAIPG